MLGFSKLVVDLACKLLFSRSRVAFLSSVKRHSMCIHLSAFFIFFNIGAHSSQQCASLPGLGQLWLPHAPAQRSLVLPPSYPLRSHQSRQSALLAEGIAKKKKRKRKKKPCRWWLARQGNYCCCACKYSSDVALPPTGSGSSLPAAVGRLLPQMLLSIVSALSSAVQAIDLGSSRPVPYIPTTILLGGANNSVAYIFAPGTATAGAALLALNLSTTASARAPNTRVVTPELPFVDSSVSSTFTASVSQNGTMVVFAGDCGASTASASVWTYDTLASSPSWTRHHTNAGHGPFLLGSSATFSSQLEPTLSTPTTYVYGGMCPFANASASSWQASAKYSNRMTKLVPARTSSFSSVQVAGSDGAEAQPPIAEAGFSFTRLAPSRTETTTTTQQVRLVVLGGHTAGAFVNMSTAAVWSLPDETWKYVSIAAGTKAAVLRRSVAVDSRSGHTTVLAADGTSLVILGGWVGDESTPASPQLAVVKLNAADGYDWVWGEKEGLAGAQPVFAGRDGQKGIYGHAAAVLPGNVMMVYGGYGIVPSSPGRKGGRAASTAAMFLNLTSLAWVDEYTNPTAATTLTTPGTNTPASASSTLLGLGLGLGLGLPLFLVLLATVVVLCRRQQRAQNRDSGAADPRQEMRQLTLGPGPDDDTYGMGWHQTSGTTARDWCFGGPDACSRGGVGRQTPDDKKHRNDSLCRRDGHGAAPSNFSQPAVASCGLGVGMGIPSIVSAPARLLPRPGAYTPVSAISGGDVAWERDMHPIYEENEDDPPSAPPAAAASTTRPSPSHRKQPPQDQEVRNWVLSGSDAHEAVLVSKIGAHTHASLVSPLRNRAPSTSKAAAGSSCRSAMMSSRTGYQTPTTAVAATRTSGTSDESSSTSASGRPGSSGGDSSINIDGTFPPLTMSLKAPQTQTQQQQNGDARPGVGGSDSGSSLSTLATADSKCAAATFARLRADRESWMLEFRPLLVNGDTPARHQDQIDSHLRRDESDDDSGEDFEHLPGSFTKNKPLRRSWLGSIKRVLSSGGPSSRPSASTFTSTFPVSAAFPAAESSGDGHDPFHNESGGLGIGQEKTSNPFLLRRGKTGPRAWLPVGGDLRDGGERDRGKGEVGNLGLAEDHDGHEGEFFCDDEEWDIERALEQRLVQVMFTVPRQRLRVVNAEVEDQEEVASLVVVDAEDAGEEEAKDSSTAAMQSGGGDGGGAGRLGKRKSRVLEMVETIELRSRDPSPGRHYHKPGTVVTGGDGVSIM